MRLRRGGWLMIVSLACLLIECGCDGGPAKAPTVDSGRAREVLNTVLEKWKSGAKIEELKTGSPSITVQDFDWMGGAKLVNYEVIGEANFDDANLRIPVKLSLSDASGKALEKQVSYVVGTSPAVTVFREMGP